MKDKQQIIKEDKKDWYAIGSIILYLELILFGLLGFWFVSDYYSDIRISGMFILAWIYLISVKLRKELTYVED